MIRELTINDNDEFQTLGKLLKDNFKDLYNLEEEINRGYSVILGYEEDNKIVAFLHIKKRTWER